MGIEVSWLSQPGMRTGENRDCAGVGIRADDALCIVLDGSTTSPTSGALVQQISQDLIDWYVASDEEMTAETLTARLRQMHKTLSQRYSRDSASYMIVHVQYTNPVIVLHAGDCLLGRYQEKSGIEWLSQPHTLANVTGRTPIAEIAGLPARHRLTRSFRPREFMHPDVFATKADGEFVVATDGFWADLSSSDQIRFIERHDTPADAEGDDRSVLRIRPLGASEDNQVRSVCETPNNLYVKRTS
jgi:serine/threonine protein phosphatase PrpC